MAKAPKKPASTAKKAAKAPAKPAVKAKAKVPVKKAAKAPAKPAVVAKPAVATAVVTPLKPVPQPKTTPGSKSPEWLTAAIEYAQQNPAVTLVGLVAAALGLVLLFS